MPLDNDFLDWKGVNLQELKDQFIRDNLSLFDCFCQDEYDNTKRCER